MAAGKADFSRDEPPPDPFCHLTQMSGFIFAINRIRMDALPFCRATLHGVRCPIGPYLSKVKGYPAKPKTIGEAIRKRRLDLGLRQIDVAKIIRCNQMSVLNWEKGHTQPQTNKMAEVQRFLNDDPFTAF